MVKELEQVNIQTTKTDVHQIVLYNDDYNTFDWVIECLVDICGHSATQAEQCAMIVHFKGKYPIKSGSRREMTEICLSLLDRGLTAEVE